MNATVTGNRALDIEEPPIFELHADGRHGVDFTDPPPPGGPNRLAGQARRGPVGLPDLSETAGGAPLHAAFAQQFLHRHRNLSAGFVHNEAQPAAQ